MKYLQFSVFLVSLLLTSCGSVGQGMLAALAGYNHYGYANPYSYFTETSSPSTYSSGTVVAPTYSSYPSTSSSTVPASTGGSSSSSSSRSQDCPSLKVSNAKWYCGNTGKCGMCGGDGLMNGSFGSGANSLKCTLCNGTGRCKYCR